MKKRKKARKPVRPKKAKVSKPKQKVRAAKKHPAKKRIPSAKKQKAPTAAPKLTVIPPEGGILLGRVEDYFAHIGVIALTLKKELQAGQRIHILGHTTNLEQIVDSMQIEHQPVSIAKAGDAVGIKVTARCRRGDYVFLIP